MDRSDEEWRKLFRLHRWPDPPPGVVEGARYIMGVVDLWVLVDGQWYWSRDACGDWKPSVYGPTQ